MYNAARRRFFFRYWEDEWQAYAKQLLSWETKESLGIYKKMQENSKERSLLVKRFLELFLDRCAFWHAFAFFQHRSTVQKHKFEELEIIFENRRRCMMNLLDKVGELMILKTSRGGSKVILGSMDMDESFR